jgi:mRNA interferase MazF
MAMKRGEVWLVTLDPTIGSEIRKTRPCLLVSPDAMINGLQTVIIAPMTSKGRQTSFRPVASFRRINGLILLDQMRTVDKSRLIRRLGRLENQVIAESLEMLRWIFTE